ncbi:hypothetical protein EDC04DRAFT_2609232 [Pisolithus marmoratus]|nr:hypothetical protein EDC04DRAFT_2609232 [Pisolithus marmoratus]
MGRADIVVSLIGILRAVSVIVVKTTLHFDHLRRSFRHAVEPIPRYLHHIMQSGLNKRNKVIETNGIVKPIALIVLRKAIHMFSDKESALYRVPTVNCRQSRSGLHQINGNQQVIEVKTKYYYREEEFTNNCDLWMQTVVRLPWSKEEIANCLELPMGGMDFWTLLLVHGYVELWYMSQAPTQFAVKSFAHMLRQILIIFVDHAARSLHSVMCLHYTFVLVHTFKSCKESYPPSSL